MSRTTRIALWSVIALAILARAFLLPLQTAIEWADGVSYAVVGKSIISGNGIADSYGPHTLWPPLYPALIGAASLVIPDLEMAGRIVSLLASIVAVLLSYLIARAFFSREAGLYTALFLALHPDLARFSLAVMSESTYLCLVLTGIWLTLGALERVDYRRLALAGLALGCAYLTRPEAIGFAVLVPLVVLCAHYRPAVGGREAWGGVLALLAGFLVCAVPYVIFLHTHTGNWALSGKTGYNLGITDPRLGSTIDERYHGLAPDGITLGLDRVTTSDVVDYWLDHPWTYATRYLALLKSQYQKMLAEAVHPLILVLLGIGLWGGRWREQLWGKLLTLGSLYPLFVYPLMHTEQRYLYPLLPFLLIFAGQGAAMVASALWDVQKQKMPFGRHLPLSGLANLAVVALLLLIYREFLVRPYAMGREEKVMGQWIKEHVGPGAKIMTHTHLAAFHAEGIPVSLPNAPLDDVLKYGAHHDAEYLVVSGDFRLHPELKLLVQQAEPPPSLTRLHVLNPSAELQIRKRLALYRINDAGGGN